MKNRIISSFVLVLAMLAGCNSTPEDHGHEHEAGGLEPLAYTIYTNKVELFVEFKPLVVGEQSRFAAHFTVLGEHFTALTEGTVSVSLIVGNNGIKNSIDSASSPGIFRLALLPKNVGTGKLVFDIKTKDFTDRITIENVKVYENEEQALADQGSEAAGDDITYLKEQAWKVEFANEPVAKTTFNDVIKTSGQILPAPGDEMVVVASAGGIVMFSGRTIVGSAVTAGTPLFTIAGGSMAEDNIDAAYKEAKANYDKAKADYERASELVKDKIISEREFLDAKVRYENAQTAFNTIAKNYSSKGQGVASPISGYVKNLLVSEGQYVAAGTPLATISQNKKLMLQANVSQKYFSKLSTITSANFKIAGSDEVYNTEKLNGKIVSFGKSAASNSPFIPITFEIDNQGGIIPGSIVEVYLISSPVADVLTVPLSSLLEEQGHYYVYVQTAGESVQKREVRLGMNDGVRVQVLSGITEGERVVTKGAYNIKLSSASGTLPAHGHEH